jgi:hypothetical protein
MSNSFLDQFNLSAQERRIVVGIAVVVFVILNLLLVWPHFSDLSRVRKQLDDTRQQMVKWNKEILLDTNPTNGYQKQLQKLERQQGGAILNQQIQLQTTIYKQASRSGVNVDNYTPFNSSHGSNEFFEEQSEKITFESQESQLIGFLFNIGNDASMIRVKELNLKPADANRYRLRGDAILSANYAKQPATAAPAPVKAPPAGAKTPGAIRPPNAPTTGPGGRPLPGASPLSNPRTSPGIPGLPPARKNL